jgi:hypothetical protein
MTQDAKPLVSLCEIFVSFSSVLGFVGAGNETRQVGVRVLREPQITGRSVIARPRPESLDTAVAQFIGWRQAQKPQPEKKLRESAAKVMKSLARVNLCADAVLYEVA